MEISCLIIDDEPAAQRIIEKYLENIPMLKLEGKCLNAMEASQIMLQKKIDLIFLDINMPKITGLSFIKSLKNPPLTIITTAYRDYAIESFELDVLDYLMKPFSFERFLKAVNKALDKLNEKKDPPYLLQESQRQQIDEAFIFIKDDKLSYRVNLKDIQYIEAVGDYIRIFTTEKVLVSYQTMKHIETILPRNMFPRIHKSYIISISKINFIEGNIVKIKDQAIPIGQTYRKDFFELIESFNSINL